MDRELDNLNKSFSELLDIHRSLDELFARHQYALLHFDFTGAAELLAHYNEYLTAHMRHEEELLLPVYSERATIERGGDTKLFLDEHEKMRNFVAMLTEALAELANADPPEPKLLQLLDREFFYLKLCSHHDGREARFLYPALDTVTSDEERAELLEGSRIEIT